MTNGQRMLIDQVAADHQMLEKKMLWEADAPAMATLSAFLYAGAGKRAEIDRYVECKQYFNDTVSGFSAMHGIAKTIVITKMSLQEDYRGYLDGVVAVYKKLRDRHKLTASAYMTLTAINIFEAGGLEKADENIDRLEKVYADMQASHYFLTGDEDRPFLAMAVSRGLDVTALAREVDACYEACKGQSFSDEAVHTAAQILSLSPRSPAEKAAELSDMVKAMKDQGVQGEKYRLLPLAALLCMVEGDPQEKCREIRELADYFKTQKGYGWFLESTKRTMYAMLAYAMDALEVENVMLNSVISSSVAEIIMDEVITMTTIACVTATVVATSSSHSNG